jgi:oxygen-dependent protoporphyrinogen oxidase
MPVTNPDPSRKRVAVLGGGIAGLSAAYALARARRDGAPIEEFLIEGKDRLGGVIRTEQVDGFVIEAGPDSFITEKPEAAALARELGLGDSLMGSNDARRRTYILHRGRLVPLPDGLMFLVPTRLWPMVTTTLLPLSGKLAMAAEIFASPPSGGSGGNADESVASFVRRHFGDAMLANIADPLLAGVYGGDSGALSVRSVLPRFWEMERRFGSLTRATLRAMRRRKAMAGANGSATPDSAGTDAAPRGPSPLFMTLRAGLEQLTGKLEEHLDAARVHLARRVAGIGLAPGGTSRYQVLCDGGVRFDADAVIFAMPAHECGRLLSRVDPELSGLLAEIPYSSAMTVSLGYAGGTAERLPAGFGYLVPRKENRRMLACTFVHRKFDHRAPEGMALLRCFLGGSRDPEALKLSDEEVVLLVRQELKEILDFSFQPLFCRVHRWRAAMAQYPVGHTELMSKIRTRLDGLRGISLAGNAYSGIGISDCIRTGRAAAERAVAEMEIRSEA